MCLNQLTQIAEEKKIIKKASFYILWRDSLGWDPYLGNQKEIRTIVLASWVGTLSSDVTLQFVGGHYQSFTLYVCTRLAH